MTWGSREKILRPSAEMIAEDMTVTPSVRAVAACVGVSTGSRECAWRSAELVRAGVFPVLIGITLWLGGAVLCGRTVSL